MISFIKGKIESLRDNIVILENNGIGYKVHISQDTMKELQGINEEIKLFTHMNVREDDISLFGFLNIDELDMFNQLILVSGIGAKVALGILGSLSVESIINAIVSEDFDMLSKAQGVGKKTAQRIVLDLKDKMELNNNIDNFVDETKSGNNKNTAKQEAVEALISLGYNRNEAFKAVLEVTTEDMTVNEIIKNALKRFIR